MTNNTISGPIQSNPLAAGTSSQASGSVTNTSSSTDSGSTAYGLEKGQIIKGEVIDLKNNEVSVKLSDGQVLKGRLTADANNLSIGSRVSFRVEDSTSQTLTLKIIPESSASYLESTIDTALEAASLSKLPKNRSLVSELLSSSMSINKNNLLLFSKLMSQFPEASIKSLIFLKQNNLPINQASIELVEGFLHSNGKMMINLATLAEDISGLPAKTADPISSQALLRLLLEDKSMPENAISSEGITISSALEAENTTNAQIMLQGQNISMTQESTVGSLLSAEERAVLADGMKSLPIIPLDDSMLEELLNGTLSVSSLKEAAKLLKENTESPLIENLTNKILSTVEEAQGNYTTLAEILPSESRANLLMMVQGLPEIYHIPDSFSESIMNGSISVSGFLGQIGSPLSFDATEGTSPALHKFTSSKEFQVLLNSKLLSDWTLSPEDLTKPDAVKNHYENLLKQLTDIKNLAETSTFTGSPALQSQLANVTDTIQYMNMFQHMLSYLQLPVKLKNQYAQSELYVYSNKKSNLDIAEGVKLVLHLKMDNLGPVDIAIELTRSNLKNTFYLDSKESLELLTSHMETLEKKLSDKGYQVSTEFYSREKSSEALGKDLADNILHAKTDSSPSPAGKRYHFDIRA